MLQLIKSKGLIILTISIIILTNIIWTNTEGKGIIENKQVKATEQNILISTEENVLIKPIQHTYKIKTNQFEQIKQLVVKVIEILKNTVEENTYYQIPLSYELQNYIKETCEKYDVDVKLVLGIMKTESTFNHNVSSKNNSGGGSSCGIMQLNTARKSYIKWYGELTGIGDSFDYRNIYHNIEAGIAVYKYYRNYWEVKGYKGTELNIRALNSYNMGIANFERYIRNTGSISRSYDKKVYKNMEGLECVEVIHTKD